MGKFYVQKGNLLFKIKNKKKVRGEPTKVIEWNHLRQKQKFKRQKVKVKSWALGPKGNHKAKSRNSSWSSFNKVWTIQKFIIAGEYSKARENETSVYYTWTGYIERVLTKYLNFYWFSKGIENYTPQVWLLNCFCVLMFYNFFFFLKKIWKTWAFEIKIVGKSVNQHKIRVKLEMRQLWCYNRFFLKSRRLR